VVTIAAGCAFPPLPPPPTPVATGIAQPDGRRFVPDAPVSDRPQSGSQSFVPVAPVTVGTPTPAEEADAGPRTGQ
jgi:hypothetical protein